jgi:formyl-CoA transferase
MAMIGLGGDPRVATFRDRVEHRDVVDDTLAAWVRERTLADVLRAFEEAHAAAAPVHTMADILADPHLAARGALPELGGIPMQGLIARFSATPGRLRWSGRELGADTDEVLTALEADDIPAEDHHGRQPNGLTAHERE